MVSALIHGLVVITTTRRLVMVVIEVVVHEPALEEEHFFHSRVIRDLEAFKRVSDVIVANRVTGDIEDAAGKIYTRDLFGSD